MKFPYFFVMGRVDNNTFTASFFAIDRIQARELAPAVLALKYCPTDRDGSVLTYGEALEYCEDMAIPISVLVLVESAAPIDEVGIV